MVPIAAIAALGSAAIGAISSAAQNRKARNLVQQQRDENRSWYTTRMNEDYTNRVDSQAVINKQREILSEQAANARGANAVAGGSPESEAISKAQANSSLAQTMADISAQGAAYKDKVEESYRSQDAQLNQQQAQIAHDQAVATAQAASQAVNAGINAVGNGTALGGKSTGSVNNVNSALQNASAQQTLASQQKSLNDTIRNSIIKH